MFTDIVGYSKMVEKDETHAIKILNEHNQLIETVIKQNSGKIIKHIGDAVFAEFSSTEDAVNSAILFQNKFKDRNALCRKEDCIVVRAGIHKGEVIEQEDDLFGNAVNLGSRIEGTAPPGGIAISDVVKKELSDNISVRVMGHVKLKNISHPLEIFKVYLDKEEFNDENAHTLRQLQIERGINIVDIDTYVVEEIFSLGILIIQSATNLHADELGYIITDQIISHFQKIKQINMPNINDSIIHGNSKLPPVEIARRLEVNNLIYGNIMKKDDELSIDLNMLDTTKGLIVWNEKFTGNQNNLGILYGRIIENILQYFNIEIPTKIKKLISKSMTDNPNALKSYYRGMSYIEKARNKEDLSNAKTNFVKASELDDNFVESIAQLAITCDKLGFHHEADEYIQEAISLAKSLGSEGSMAMVYNCAGILFKEWNKYKKAIPYFKKALEIQIHLEDQLMEAKILNNLAGCYSNTSDPEYAEELLVRSIGIKEYLEDGKSLAYSYAELGNTYLIKGDITNAVNNFQKSLGQFNYYEMDYFVCRILILLAQAKMDIGDFSVAKRYLKQARPICIDLNESLMMGKLFFYEAKYFENTEDADAAVQYYNDSIEYFQKGELYRPLIYAIISLAMLEIKKCLFSDAGKLYSKAESIIKRISNPSAALSININKLYLNSILNKCTLQNCKNLLDSLEIDDADSEYLDWWMLAQSFYNLESIELATKCQTKAQKLLTESSLQISDKRQQKAYLRGDIIKKEIWGDLSKSAISSIDSDMVSLFLKFCPGCGTSNEDQNKFCSNCGHDLVKKSN